MTHYIRIYVRVVARPCYTVPTVQPNPKCIMSGTPYSVPRYASLSDNKVLTWRSWPIPRAQTRRLCLTCKVYRPQFKKLRFRLYCSSASWQRNCDGHGYWIACWAQTWLHPECRPGIQLMVPIRTALTRDCLTLDISDQHATLRP